MFKLKWKITLSILLVSIATALIMGLYSWSVYRDSVVAASMEQLERYVQDRWFIIRQDMQDATAGRELLTHYVENTFSVEQMRRDPAYMERYKQQLRTVVATVAQANKSLSAYVYFDPDFTGTPDSVWMADMDRNGQAELQAEFPLDYYSPFLPNRQWFYTPLRENRPIWTAPYQGNMDYNKDLVFISHTGPIVVQNRVIAVSGVDYYLDQLIAQVAQLQFEGTEYAILLDGHLKTLVYPSLETGTYFPSVALGQGPAIASALNGSSAGTLEFVQADGKTRLLKYRKLDNGWIFGCVLYEADALAKLRDLQRFITLLLLAVAVVGGLFSLYFGRFISSPLEQLTRVVRQIGDGNYEARIDDETLGMGDEIGDLSRSVEKMRMQLLDDFDKIATHHQSLEGQIEQRTAELKHINDELEASLDSLMKSQNQLVITEKTSALGYMISGIAHELNTPLGNSVTLASYITDQTDSLLERLEAGQITRQDLDVLLHAVSESGALIQRNLSKVDLMLQKFRHLAESATLSEVYTFNVLEYLRYSVARVNTFYGQHRLQVVLQCPEDLEFHSDPVKFSQIVFNLLSNSHQHGFPEADEGAVEIGVTPGEGYLVLQC